MQGNINIIENSSVLSDPRSKFVDLSRRVAGFSESDLLHKNDEGDRLTMTQRDIVTF